MARDKNLSREDFARDVAQHAMIVLRDDDLYRHVRFKQPRCSSYWFELITWPGGMLIDGDCGTFVFRRLEDMFQFFRRGTREGIDFRYWAEKCEAEATRGAGIEQFDPSELRAELKRRLVDLVRLSRDDLDKEQRREMWTSFHDDVLSRIEDYGCGQDGSADFARAYDWSFTQYHGFDRVKRWSIDFDDMPQCKVYTSRFLWCCYAIAWGIGQYDAHKVAHVAPAATSN